MKRKITITRKEERVKYDAIMFCVEARAKDVDEYEKKQNFNLLCVKKDHVVATDGHRLHFAPVSGIPTGLYKYSKEMHTITLKLRVGKGSRRYPDYENVIPKTFAHEVEVENAEFASLCRSAKIISSSNYSGASLTFNKSLKVKMVNPGIGDMWGEMKISASVKPAFEVGMNTNYLIGALKVLGKRVTIGLPENANNAVVFKDAKKPFFDNVNLALIMPMRV